MLAFAIFFLLLCSSDTGVTTITLLVLMCVLSFVPALFLFTLFTLSPSPLLLLSSICLLPCLPSACLASCVRVNSPPSTHSFSVCVTVFPFSIRQVHKWLFPPPFAFPQGRKSVLTDLLLPLFPLDFPFLPKCDIRHQMASVVRPIFSLRSSFLCPRFYSSRLFPPLLLLFFNSSLFDFFPPSVH